MDQPAAPVVPLRAVPPPAADRATAEPDANLLILPINGVFTDESRRHAYESWAWLCGRAFAETSRRTGVPLRTLHHWAKTEGWRERYEQERADLAPVDVRYWVALGLGNDAMAARDYLGAVARGELPGDKLRLLAATSVLDRAGFAPIHFSQAELNQERRRREQQHDDAMAPEQVAALSPEERRAALHRMLNEGRG